MIVENIKNRITRMVMDSEIVYVDGMTIKDRDNEPTHRDSKKGKRYLELHSEYVL